MRKKILSILLLSVIILSFNTVQTFAASEKKINKHKMGTEAELNGNIYNYDQLVTTNGWSWTAITKTITKNYNDPDVPAAVYYTEYIDGKWYSGELKRTGEVEKISATIWQATYTGKINY